MQLPFCLSCKLVNEGSGFGVRAFPQEGIQRAKGAVRDLELKPGGRIRFEKRIRGGMDAFIVHATSLSVQRRRNSSAGINLRPPSLIVRRTPFLTNLCSVRRDRSSEAATSSIE